ncbi:MAG: hypothetical protein JXP73_04200 [Deltaproteobacteria bacterium]|nr:hypothetical protein [Deltaproteobacteria bacterium]
MKPVSSLVRTSLPMLAILGIGVMACTQSNGGGGAGSGGTTNPSGGSGGSVSGGGTLGSGGEATGSGGKATGSGGSVSRGGTPGSGGQATGSGGKATGSGGSASRGGTPGSGGQATGSGGETTGSGGRATGRGGATTGDGGQVTGTGGSRRGSGGSTADAGSGNADAAAKEDTGTPTQGDFDVEHHLSSDEDPKAPGTIGIVSWALAAGTVSQAHIEFGLDTSYGMNAPVDLELAEGRFRTLLLGMKPDHTYHFRIVAVADGATYASDDYTIQTGPPLSNSLVSVRKFNVINEAAREPGFIVASYWTGTGSSVAFIIDRDGDIVWWHNFALSGSGMTGDGGICRARMSADGKHMWMVVSSNKGGLIRSVGMDSLDEVAYQGTVASHDITPVEGATMAYLDYGEKDCNSIFEIDPKGTPREVVEASDFITGGGMCHGNALRYSQKEDMYTYSEVSSGIYVIDRKTGKLQWKLTDKVSASSWGGANHGHHLLDNSLLLFANKGGSNASAVFEYALDGKKIMSYDSGRSAQNLGDVQRLPGGNTLVSYSNSQSYIHEIDENQKLVLEIDLGAGGPSLGYVLWRPSLYGPPPDIGL